MAEEEEAVVVAAVKEAMAKEEVAKRNREAVTRLCTADPRVRAI